MTGDRFQLGDNPHVPTILPVGFGIADLSVAMQVLRAKITLQIVHDVRDALGTQRKLYGWLVRQLSPEVHVNNVIA
jgi:hypothetical protein